MRKNISILFILFSTLLCSCSDLDPKYPVTDDESEETLALRQRYTDKVARKWYVNQESVTYYNEGLQKLYYLDIMQYYDFRADGSMEGRLVLNIRRADNTEMATGGHTLCMDYALTGTWSLIHQSHDSTDRLRLETTLIATDPETAFLGSKLNRNLTLYYAGDNALNIDSPLSFLRQAIVLEPVDAMPE